MTGEQEQKATFESLILEARAAGREWKRKKFSSVSAHAAVTCADGRCVLGAIIHARGLKDPDNAVYDDEGTLLEGYSVEGSLDMPSENDATYLLNIPYGLALQIIAANDGLEKSRADELDAILGITGITQDAG